MAFNVMLGKGAVSGINEAFITNLDGIGIWWAGVYILQPTILGITF